MEFLAFIIMMAIVVVLSLGIAALCNGIVDRREKKRKKAHPELFQWFEECDEKASNACHWHNTEVVPLKRKVDAIINEMPYYPASTKIKKEAELEELRNDIQAAKMICNKLDEETEEVRTRIHDYVEEHDLKWAKNWGW